MFLVALLVALSLSAVPALGARGHVFSGSFAGPCLIEPCEGLLKEPAGVAVNEASGDVFVVDKGTNRVARFSATGVFEAQFKGPSATGTGTLTSGSVTVEAAVAVTGAFSVGEEVSAAGLPAGTTITAVKGEVLTVSGPATKSGSEPLTAQQSFSKLEGIAVDNACVRHKPVLTEATTPTCHEFDPTAEDVYVLDAGNSVIDRFSPSGVYLGQLTGTFREPPAPKGEFKEEHVFRELHGVAVDTAGHVWVAESTYGGGDGGVDEFTGTQFVRHIALTDPSSGFMERGLALDGSGDFYVKGFSFEGSKIQEFDSNGKVMNEHVDVVPSSGLAVEVSSGDVYVDEGALVSRFDSAGVLLEQSPVPGGAGGELGVNDVTQTLYVADPAGGVVDVFAPEPPGPPTVQAPSVNDVTATSAKLGGEVNPHGAPTTARVEYGRCESVEQCPSAAFGESLPAGSGVVGSDFELTLVAAQPSDLLPGSVYHFRLRAVNSDGEATGEERVFTTQPAAGAGPVPVDGRQWQLVSPPDKHGAQLQPISAGAIQAAVDGGAVSYFANAPTEADAPGSSNNVQIISHRASAGWVSEDIATPHVRATGVGAPEYRFFSADLSAAVVQPAPPFVALSASASELTAFLRSDLGIGEACGASCYRPLVTGCPPPGQTCPLAVQEAANVPPGTVFGQPLDAAQGEYPNVLDVPFFRGATPDLTHVVLEDPRGLTEGTEGGLYLWSGGRLAFIGNAQGAGRGVTYGGFYAIATDGSRVVFSEGQPGTPLLLRDMATGQGLALDTVEGGTGEGPAHPEFQFATPDAGRVLFTDTQQLTPGSLAAGNAPDLYECQVVSRAGKLACDLTDLTSSAAEPGGVVGHVLGASSDASTVYFAANGVLAPGAVHGNCHDKVVGNPPGAQCNLYASRRGTPPTLVAVLSGEDAPDWEPNRGKQPTAVSASGGWLTFASQVAIPTVAFPHGYDNRDAVSGLRDEEVYLYHQGGGVVCVSCQPSGARPHGVEYLKLSPAGGGLAGGEKVWQPHQPIAGSVPPLSTYEGGNGTASLSPSRFLNDSGRLFFNTSEGLVPSDGNANEDVYQFEPAGVGACTTTSTAYNPALSGCIGLISSGRDAKQSAFIDASATGNDVFFLTSARLSKADTDTSVDLYDAHECTTGSPCLPTPAETPPSCSSGDSCKPAPSPQPDIFGPGASQTFNGPGNLTSQPPARAVKSKKCKKGLVEKHNRCVHSRRRHKRTNGKRRK